MDWLPPLVMYIIAAVALIYFGLGLFNVEWHLRIRILAALAIGALLVGGIGWPLVRPADPLGPVSLFTGEISLVDIIVLIVMGFAAGALATLACYPLGSALGQFAAPAGIAVLALSSGSMRNLLLYNQDFQQRSQLYSSLRWELLLWLAVCAAGWAAVLLASRLIKTKTVNAEAVSANQKSSSFNGIAAIVLSAIVIYFTLGIFAQDIRQMDEKLGSVTGLPGNGQIAFGIFVSAGLASFLARYLVKADYKWAVLGAAGSYFIMFSKIAGSSTLEYLVKQWPIDYLSHSIYAMTPLQFASFTVLGALTGHWIAVRTQQKTPSQA